MSKEIYPSADSFISEVIEIGYELSNIYVVLKDGSKLFYETYGVFSNINRTTVIRHKLSMDDLILELIKFKMKDLDKYFDDLLNKVADHKVDRVMVSNKKLYFTYYEFRNLLIKVSINSPKINIDAFIDPNVIDLSIDSNVGLYFNYIGNPIEPKIDLLVNLLNIY
jgi:hypothetical protein